MRPSLGGRSGWPRRRAVRIASSCARACRSAGEAAAGLALAAARTPAGAPAQLALSGRVSKRHRGRGESRWRSDALDAGAAPAVSMGLPGEHGARRAASMGAGDRRRTRLRRGPRRWRSSHSLSQAVVVMGVRPTCTCSISRTMSSRAARRELSLSARCTSAGSRSAAMFRGPRLGGRTSWVGDSHSKVSKNRVELQNRGATAHPARAPA